MLRSQFVSARPFDGQVPKGPGFKRRRVRPQVAALAVYHATAWQAVKDLNANPQGSHQGVSLQGTQRSEPCIALETQFGAWAVAGREQR